MSDDVIGLGEMNALLGPGTTYKGKLTFAGRVRLEGKFEGEIFSDDMLIVANGAEIKATIDVGTLIVLGGEVHGAVRARQLVELHNPGQVHGDIETPQIFIDKGAAFFGKCTMTEGEPSVHEMEPKNAPEGAASKEAGAETTETTPEAEPGREKPTNPDGRATEADDDESFYQAFAGEETHEAE